MFHLKKFKVLLGLLFIINGILIFILGIGTAFYWIFAICLFVIMPIIFSYMVDGIDQIESKFNTKIRDYQFQHLISILRERNILNEIEEERISDLTQERRKGKI